MLRLLTLALCLSGSAALSQTQSCVNAQNQMEITECAYRDWQIADAELNVAYKRVMDVLRAQDADLGPSLTGGADALRDAQRAWITFRDKTCEAEGFVMRGGSGEPMVVAFCLARLTRERSVHLWGMLQAYGG